MDITSLDKLINSESISFFPTSMLVKCSSRWVVSGEDRISYTTIIRLVECCREYHWKQDISSYSHRKDLDSITVSVQGEFNHPVFIGSDILISYYITDFSTRKYKICFELSDVSRATLYAKVFLVLVFYDPDKRCSVAPPAEVAERLRLMAHT